MADRTRYDPATAEQGLVPQARRYDYRDTTDTIRYDAAETGCVSATCRTHISIRSDTPAQSTHSFTSVVGSYRIVPFPRGEAIRYGSVMGCCDEASSRPPPTAFCAVLPNFAATGGGGCRDATCGVPEPHGGRLAISTVKFCLSRKLPSTGRTDRTLSMCPVTSVTEWTPISVTFVTVVTAQARPGHTQPRGGVMKIFKQGVRDRTGSPFP